LDRSTTGRLDFSASSLFGLVRVDRSKRLEFVHITKTGGSAIEMGAARSGYLWGACHYKKYPHLGCKRNPDWDFPLSLELPQHLKHKKHGEPWHTPPHWLIPNPQPKHQVVNFAVVRNPYQRVLSEFYCSAFGYNGTISTQSLNEWIMEKVNDNSQYYGHLLPQHYYIFHHQTGARVVDHVLRYEFLDEDFQRLMKSYLIRIRLPKKSKSRFVKFFEHSTSRLTVADLTDEALQVINTYYEQDFDIFGYGMILPG
jgi:hypothetical protein